MQRLGELLVSQGILTEADITAALDYQKIHHVRLGEALIALELLQEDDMLSVLSTQLGLQVMREGEARKLHVDSDVVSQIPLDMLKANKFMPVHYDKNGSLLVLCNDINDGKTVELCEKTYNAAPMRLVLAKTSLILSKLADYEHEAERIESRKRISSIVTTAARTYDLNADESIATVKEVNYIILNANRMRASDIHLIQDETLAYLWYRVDGIMYQVDTYPVHRSNPLINRAKNMSSVLSTNHKFPQDGGFKVIADGKSLDIRLSTMPTNYGEKLVLRISDRDFVNKLTIDDLGLSEHNKKRYLSMLKKPKGMLLVTGATGSGKSITLNVFVNYINDGTRSIHIVADPVEHKISGVGATQINEKAGITYQLVLRHLLRQDPNVLVVGEIRDSVVAEMSVGAAMTGHLILSTLHTNDSVTAIDRLRDLKIEPYKICASLLGVSAQVLVRKTCLACKGKGCDICNHTGFFGRTPLQEVLVFSPRMKKALMNNESIEILREIAAEEGLVSILDDGYEKVRQGITTMEEVHRVVAERDE